MNKNTKLVTLNVISLYSNIPTSLGLETVKFYMEKFPDLLNNRLNQTFILEGLTIVLENNSFAYTNPHSLCTILERDMMSNFPNFVKNVRAQALRDSNLVEENFGPFEL